jgi:hypothetical protein
MESVGFEPFDKVGPVTWKEFKCVIQVIKSLKYHVYDIYITSNFKE